MGVLRFIRRLLSEQPVRFSLAVGALGLVGLLEGIGVAAIVPLFSLLSGDGAGTSGMSARLVSGALDLFGLDLSLGSVLGFIVVIVLLEQAALIAQNKIVWGAIYRFEANLRKRLYRHAFDSSWEFFVGHKTSDLVNALTVEATRASSAYIYVNQMLGAMFVVVVYLALAFLLSWQMTVVVLVAGGGLAVVLRRRVSAGTRFGASVTDSNAEVQKQALENIAGAKLVKGYAAEAETVARLDRPIDRLAGDQYRSQMNRAWLRSLYDAVSVSTAFVGVYVAATYLHISLASLVVFLFIFYRVSPRLSNLQVLMHGLLSYLPALEAIDALCAEADAQSERHGGAEPPTMRSGITFEGVDFAYGGGVTVLDGVNIRIPKGRTVAVVGPSGAGKTTVIDLVMGLLEPTGGRVLIDDVDLATIDLRTWRRRIGYVAQDSVLFHASIRENLTWANPDATDADIAEALELANAAEFVDRLPEGLDTVVGDRGMRLSGGQKQRIALARAIIRKPDVLILDEATSALDTESEQHIQASVGALAERMTILVVTHRLATVKGADLIHVLQSGSVVEQGSWDELVSSEGRFWELMRMQELESVIKEVETDE